MSSSNLSKNQTKLRNAFKPSKPTEELLKTFRKMKTRFDETELALECSTLVTSLQRAKGVEDAHIFAKKANKIILFGNDNDKCPDCSLADNFNFLNAKVLNTRGSNSLDLSKYRESLNYLNLANRILTTKFDEVDENRCDGKCLLLAKAFNQHKLHRVGLLTNKLEKSVLHGKNHLEIKKRLVDRDCVEMALAYMNVFFAYGTGMKFREALPYGWKAVEIHVKNSGRDSVEAAKLRRNLAYMYHQLGEHEKAFDLKGLADNVVRTRDSPNDMLKDGRYEEAIAVWEDKVSRADGKEDERVLDLLCLTHAFFKLGKFPEAKKHMRSADEILTRCPGLFIQSLPAATCVEMSELYEKMNDTEAALSMAKKVLAIHDLPMHLLLQSLSRLLSLIPESGKAREEIPDMLYVVEKLKVSYGPESRKVGYVYSHLGVAYWNSGQQELAVKFQANAKGILDATIGPNHINSLETSHTLSEFYGKMGSYDQAIEIQEKVVRGFRVLGPSKQKYLDRAISLLEEMKGAAIQDNTVEGLDAKGLRQSEHEFQDEAARNQMKEIAI